MLEEEIKDNRADDDLRAQPSEHNFHNWLMRLMRVNTHHREFGWSHPMGTCAYRDILRDKPTKEALENAFNRIIINGEEPIDG